MFRQFALPRFTRVAYALLALLWLALLTGCWLDLDGPQSTFDVRGPVARSQLNLFYVTVAVTAVIFVVVGSVLAYATLRFRARTDADEQAEPPPQSHGNFFVEVSLVSASVLCLVIIAIPTLKAIWFTYDVPAAEKKSAYEVTATGTQWWFRFEYPAEQIDGVGPLVTANELVIPAGRPVHVNLRTFDVVHSFWVPKLAGKVDMIPNRPNHLWLEAEQPGYYYGQCAEFCGDSHALMRFRVIALAPADFAAWVAHQKEPARTVTPAMVAAAQTRPHVMFASWKPGAGPGEALAGSPAFDANPFEAWKEKQIPDPADEDAALIAQGQQLFADKTCMSCHTIQGHYVIRSGQKIYFQGITGPNLTHVGARTTIAAGVLENTPRRMHEWLNDPNHFKPGNKMFNGGFIDPETGRRLINLDNAEINALVAYLQSLK